MIDETDARTVGTFAFVVGFAVIGFLLFGECACSPAATTPRAQARAAVLATAEAVRAADEACAELALRNRDLELARRCETAYGSARLALIGTAGAVDAWDIAASHDSVSCAVSRAAGDLSAIVSELELRKATVPAVARDAIALARVLGGCPDAE